MSLVFDSSAMIALLHDESGADVVSELLADADVPKLAHAVNLCEVFYDAMKSGGIEWAEASVAALQAEGIEERNDLDAVFWRDVATMIGDRRRAGFRLALGDAFGVALARRLDADFVTADRHELAAVRDAGIGRITFIR